MKPVFYVDIPDPESRFALSDDDCKWINVGVFGSRRKAENYLLKTWGIKKEHSPAFISEGVE